MTKSRIAILCFVFVLAAAPAARAGRVEDLPDASVEISTERVGDRPSIFVYHPAGSGPPSIAPDPPIRFSPPAPVGGELAGWFLRTAPMVATKALTDFRLRDAGTADLAPIGAPPPRTESVPEPATVLLFLLGFLLLLAVRRRA